MSSKSIQKHQHDFSCFNYWKKWILPYIVLIFFSSFFSIYILYGPGIFEKTYFVILPHSLALVIHKNYLRYTYDDATIGPNPCLLKNTYINFQSNTFQSNNFNHYNHSSPSCLDSTSLIYKKEKGNCKNQFQGRFYLLGNKGRIPNRCMINLYHFLVEYVATIHIALEESNIDRSKPIKILLNSANDDHALPSSTFAPLLAAVLGYQNPNVVNVNNLYYKPVLSTKLCVKELVIGWATSKIWYHNPNQREKVNDIRFINGFQTLRFLLYSRFIYTNKNKLEIENQIDKKTYCFEHDNISNSGNASIINIFWWSRSNKERSVINRDESIKAIQQNVKANVQSIDSTLMSMKQQLKYISEADVLIGSHGAGLSWILAMRPSTSLVELVPSLYFRLELFRNLALVSNNLHHYYHTVCDSYIEKKNSRSDFNGIKRNDEDDPLNIFIFDNHGPERHKNHKLQCDVNKVSNMLLQVYKDMLVACDNTNHDIRRRRGLK